MAFSLGLVWNNESYRLLRKISSQSLKSYIGTYNSDLVNDGHYQVNMILLFLYKDLRRKIVTPILFTTNELVD